MLKEKKSFELDDPKTTLQHKEIILGKPFLRRLYEEWYQSFIDTVKDSAKDKGTILEIGSGGGFLKEVYKQVITSDIMPLDCCDLCFSAESMPFEDDEIDGIFMLNVLHHIPNPEKFLSEAQRTLKPGGLLMMIEPANTTMSRLIYQNFHHEPFNPNADKWEFPSKGPLSTANGALPWIIFKRDIARFNREFPRLKLTQIKQHTPFRYLLSGGLSLKTLVPQCSFAPIRFLEKMGTPLLPWIAMFQTITLTKR